MKSLFSYFFFILIGIIVQINHMEAKKKDIYDQVSDDIIKHPGKHDNIISGNNIHNRVQTNSEVYIEGLDNPFVHGNHKEGKKDIYDQMIDDIIKHPGKHDNIISGNNIHGRVQTNSDVHIKGLDKPSKNDHKDIHTSKTITVIESENLGWWQRLMIWLGFRSH